jgi:glycosyltransferase involved in cell wall biosynthesis
MDVLSNKLISISFPVYQNRGSLSELYFRCRKAVEDNFPAFQFEFVFVNDGSTDGSLEELTAIKAKQADERIKIVNFSRNFGQMAAILAGWKFATGDAVINMAADLQDPPELCIKMVQEWISGSEVVICYRETHSTSFFNKITSKIAYRLLLPRVPRGGFDVALLDRRALHAVLSINERNRFYQYDILWVGFKTSYLPYNKLQRIHGISQYNFIKRFGNFGVAFLNVSYLPLRLMTALGVVFCFSGFLYGLSILYAFFTNKIPFAGWAPIMMLQLIIGGIIMSMLGVVGEYLWRIFDETKARPVYVVKEIL